MSGGGGASGAIQLPEYIEDVHKSWIANTGFIASEVFYNRDDPSVNPFKNMVTYDPRLSFSSTLADISAFVNGLKDIDPDTSFDAYIDDAIAKIPSIVDSTAIDEIANGARTRSVDTLKKAVEGAIENIPDSMIQKLIESADRNLSIERARSIGRFTSAMSEAHDTHSSSFLLGIALIEAQHQATLANVEAQARQQFVSQGMQTVAELYRAELVLRVDVDFRMAVFKSELSMQIAQIDLASEIQYADMKRSAFLLSAEMQRLNFVVNNQYEEAVTERKVMEYRFPLELYQQASNVMAAPLGASAFVPRGNSQFANALGGGLAGAAAGAQIGAAIGPGGAGIGAGIGAAVGLIGGFTQ